MDGVIFGIFALSIILIFGAIYNTASLKKPGFFPPKKVLKRRAALFALLGLFCILLGAILSSFQ